MFYVGVGEGDPVPQRFQKYCPEWVSEIVDAENNALIFPEIFTNFRVEYKKIRLFCWWLSVDNYYLHRNKRRARILRKFGKILSNIVKDAIFSECRIVHLSQCERITQFLKGKGGEQVRSLSDYLNQEFLDAAKKRDSVKRHDVVLYNPKKGKNFTAKIMAAAKDLNFVPIQGMTPSQVADLLWSSKVYIDFGNHPGKDRFPREAAVMGCVVITGMKGSAGNDLDVPLPVGFKYHDKYSNVPAVVACIRNALQNHDGCSLLFDEYRQMILSEPARFSNDVSILFEELLVGCVG
jgi:hypothetical protein